MSTRAKLVIEVDGDTHGTDEAELQDAKRTEDLEKLGFRVIRLWNHAVLTNTDGGIEDIILEALPDPLPGTGDGDYLPGW